MKLPHRGTPKAPAKTQKKIKVEDEDDFEPEEDVDMKDLDADEDLLEPEEEERAVKSEPKETTTGRKRKSPELDPDDDEEDEKPKKKAAKKAAPVKSPAKKKVKKEDEAENADIQAIYDSIPTVRAPTPPAQDPNKKFDWRANAGRSEPAPIEGVPATCRLALTRVLLVSTSSSREFCKSGVAPKRKSSSSVTVAK